MMTGTKDYYSDEDRMGNMGNFDNWFKLTETLTAWRLDNGMKDVETIDGWIIPQSSLTAAIRALYSSKVVL